jgi:hypothetical protein
MDEPSSVATTRVGRVGFSARSSTLRAQRAVDLPVVDQVGHVLTRGVLACAKSSKTC